MEPGEGHLGYVGLVDERPDTGRTLMELFYWAMLAGRGGTVMMDTTENSAGKRTIHWGG